jgi:hypothetical protein
MDLSEVFTVGGVALQTPGSPWELNESTHLYVQLPTGTPHTVRGALQFDGLPVLPGMAEGMTNDEVADFVADLCMTTQCIALRMHGKVVVVAGASAVCQVIETTDSSAADMMAMWQGMSMLPSELEHVVVEMEPMEPQDALAETLATCTLDATTAHPVSRTYRCMAVQKTFLAELRKAFPTQTIAVDASKTVTIPMITATVAPKPAEVLMVEPYTSRHAEFAKKGNIVIATLPGLPSVHIATTTASSELTLLGQASPPVAHLWGNRALAVLTTHDVAPLTFCSPAGPPFTLYIPAGPLNLGQLADAVHQGTGCSVTFQVVDHGLHVTAEEALTVAQPGHPPMDLPTRLPRACVGLALNGPLFQGGPEHAQVLAAAGFLVAEQEGHTVAAHEATLQTMLCGLDFRDEIGLLVLSIHAPAAPAQFRLTASSGATALRIRASPNTAKQLQVTLPPPPSKQHFQLLQQVLPRNAAGEVSIGSMAKLHSTVQALYSLPLDQVTALLADLKQEHLEQLADKVGTEKLTTFLSGSVAAKATFPGGGQRLGGAAEEE